MVCLLHDLWDIRLLPTVCLFLNLHLKVNDNVEKCLCALVFNAQSICNKMDLFRALFATEKPEIVGITETWIHTYTRDFEGKFAIPVHKTFKKDRLDREGGSVMLYVRG